jgi:hypothetical protein
MSRLSDSENETEQRQDEQYREQRAEEETATHQAVAAAGCPVAT